MLRSAVANTHADALPLRFVPPPLKAPDIARLLVERYGESILPRKPASALEALLRRLRLARYDWDKVDPSDRLDVVWVLWEGMIPPAEHEAFLRNFLLWVAVPWRRLQAGRLAASWAAAFDPNLKSIRVVGDWLARHAARLPDPWPRLAEEFEIFSVEGGPLALAEAFLAGEETASCFLERLALPARAAAGGILLEALAVAAARVEHLLAGEPRLAARLCALSLHGTAFRPDIAVGIATCRAGTIRIALAEALLLPWQRAAPPPEAKARILAFLLRHYGDARMNRAPWAEMRAPAVVIMRRWLIEETVATYFRLAAQTKSADRKQLAAREAFWTSCLDQIEDAWLLGSPRSIAEFGPGGLAHGSLTGCRPGQSALLLRIGGMTVLEVSDSANESVWRHGNALAPPLYRRADQPYWPAALANGADFSSAYRNKDNETWQQRLAGFIERHSGKRLAA